MARQSVCRLMKLWTGVQLAYKSFATMHETEPNGNR